MYLNLLIKSSISVISTGECSVNVTVVGCNDNYPYAHAYACDSLMQVYDATTRELRAPLIPQLTPDCNSLWDDRDIDIDLHISCSFIPPGIIVVSFEKASFLLTSAAQI